MRWLQRSILFNYSFKYVPFLLYFKNIFLLFPVSILNMVHTEDIMVKSCQTTSKVINIYENHNCISSRGHPYRSALWSHRFNLTDNGVWTQFWVTIQKTTNMEIFQMVSWFVALGSFKAKFVSVAKLLWSDLLCVFD